jgi:ABC-type iron transport system FetAB ATPase subunit
MRIAISGTAGQGKSTLVRDFLSVWPNYNTTSGSYRDKLKPNEHSKNVNESTQYSILNWMVDEQLKYGVDDNIIYDRCALDNFVYTLWGVSNGLIEPGYINKSINIVKESFRQLDIIFLIQYDPSIAIIDDGTREPDPKYIADINNLFQGIYQHYLDNDDTIYTIFPKDDMPAIIPIYGSRQDRIAQISEYVDVSGTLVETKPEESVLSEDKLQAVEALLKHQQSILGDEELEAFEKKLRS